MAPYRDVFERYEQKYLLSREQAAALTERLRGSMEEDHYGLHTIASLYLDTDDYQIIRTSVEKPIYREKLRLRSYGIPKPNDPVFMEIKKKYQEITYKRRVAYPLEKVKRYLQTGDQPGESSQIFREIDWFMRRYQPKPKVYIAYDRVALYGSEDPALRITFDRDIRWRTTDLDLGQGDYGSLLLPSNPILMEIKISRAMPLWLNHILTDLGIFPCSLSKYGYCFEQHLCRKIGGVICA